MKVLLLGGVAAAVLGFAWFSRSEANVYPMTVADTYARLTSAKVEASGKGPLGNREISISGNGSSTIYWKAGGTFSTTRCQADLTPEGSSKTRITAYCDGGDISGGAANGMLQGMMRKRMIEHIDSTLDGRPYDQQKAMGASATGWPDDVRQPNGSFGAAVNEAVKMDRDMKKMIGEMEKTGKQMRQAQEMEYRSRSTSAATRPMTDLSN